MRGEDWRRGWRGEETRGEEERMGGEERRGEEERREEMRKEYRHATMTCRVRGTISNDLISADCPL